MRSRRWVEVATDVWLVWYDVGGQGTPRLNTSEVTSMFGEKKDDGQVDGSLVRSDVTDVFLVRAKGLNTWESMFHHAKNRSKPKNEQQREQIRRSPSECSSLHVDNRTRTVYEQPNDDCRSKAV